MIVKVIDVQVRAGHARAFRRAQETWNRESRRDPAYIGEHLIDISADRVIVLAFWRSRSAYDNWMKTEHDRIARLARSDDHYDSLTVTIVDGEELGPP